MEDIDINSKIEQKIALYKANEYAKIEKRAQRKEAALRKKIAKEIEARRQAEKSRAEAMEKLADLPRQCGYKNVSELIRALGMLLTEKQRAKVFAANDKVPAKSTRRGPGNGLSDEERAEIAKMRTEGIATAEIAKKFNVSVNTVYSIKKA